MREIIFDTETTGLSPDNGDRMVEFGCLEMIDRMLTGRSHHVYFNPGRPMPQAAEAVHGLSDAFLADKPPFIECADALLDFIGDAPLVAHNAMFDFGFLNMELARCGRDPVSLDRMVDTVAMARTKFPGAKNSLDALCSRFGIDRSHRVLHGALLDAELLAQVYIELTGGRQIGLGLASVEIERSVSVSTIYAAKPVTVRPARPHAASSAEQERHRLFIASMDKSLWSQGRARSL